MKVNYIQVVPRTFSERFKDYISDKEASKGFMEQRLKYMKSEELAFLLAVHDTFISRLDCAECKDSDVDYLGRKVDPWGRPVK